jgi:hypothetical protein
VAKHSTIEVALREVDRDLRFLFVHFLFRFLYPANEIFQIHIAVDVPVNIFDSGVAQNIGGG